LIRYREISKMKRIYSIVGAALLALGSAACSVDASGGADIVIVPATGALTVTWSIDLSQDPGACAFYGADAFELVVFDDFGGFVTDAVAPCEAFNMSIDLPDGLYDADATLLDFGGRPVTVTRTIEAIDVIPGSELVIDVDFPVGSFL
jgi:hypothetical protein